MGKNNFNFNIHIFNFFIIILFNFNTDCDREHIKVIVKSLADHPQCDHGPTLLLAKTTDEGKTTKSFFACSAFRYNCGTISKPADKIENSPSIKSNSQLVCAGLPR